MRVGQLLMGIIAARLLVPEQFGVFAATLVVYNIVVNVSELGVGSALIRSPDETERLAPTAVTLSVVTSAGLAGGMALLASVSAAGVGIPDARGPIMVMAIVVLLAGPSAVPAALLTQAFRQDRRLLADGLNFVAANGLLVVLALNGGGAYALAWSRVAGQAISVVVLLCVVERRHRPGFERDAARRLVMIGLPLVGANLVGYGVSAVDAVIVGHLLGARDLGVYVLATNVAGWPVQLMLPVLMNVGLPLVSRFRSNRREMSRVVGALLGITTMVVCPTTALLAALSASVVALLYGSSWTAAAPVLAVLTLAGAARAVLALLSDVLVSTGAAATLLGVQVVWLAVLCPLTLVGARLGGLVGAGAAVAATAALVVVPVMWIACRAHVGLSLRDLRGAPGVFGVGAVFAAAVAWAASRAGGTSSFPAVAVLLVGGTAGLAVYGFVTFRVGGTLLRRVRVLVNGGDLHGLTVRPGTVESEAAR